MYRSNLGTSRGSVTNTKGGSSTVFGVDQLPLGDLVTGLQAADIRPSDGPVHLSDFRCIASYNWLDSSEPTILVPGMSGPCYHLVLSVKHKY